MENPKYMSTWFAYLFTVHTEHKVVNYIVNNRGGASFKKIYNALKQMFPNVETELSKLGTDEYYMLEHRRCKKITVHRYCQIEIKS